MKNTQYRFRCIPNPSVVYMPVEMHDVEGMRQHPEYEEVDAEGNLIAKTDVQLVHRIPMTMTPTQKPARPVLKRRK